MYFAPREKVMERVPIAVVRMEPWNVKGTDVLQWSRRQQELHRRQVMGMALMNFDSWNVAPSECSLARLQSWWWNSCQRTVRVQVQPWIIELGVIRIDKEWWEWFAQEPGVYPCTVTLTSDVDIRIYQFEGPSFASNGFLTCEAPNGFPWFK